MKVPKIGGVVVRKEEEELLVAALENRKEHQLEMQKRAQSMRALQNWKKLYRDLLLRESLREKYLNTSPSTMKVTSSTTTSVVAAENEVVEEEEEEECHLDDGADLAVPSSSSKSLSPSQFPIATAIDVTPAAATTTNKSASGSTAGATAASNAAAAPGTRKRKLAIAP